MTEWSRPGIAASMLSDIDTIIIVIMENRSLITL